MTDQHSRPAWADELDEEFAAWRAVERETSAVEWEASFREEWEPECPPDWEADAVSGAEGASPAIERFLAAQHTAGELLVEWEHAAGQLARWQSVQLRVLADAYDLTVAGDAVSKSGLPLRSMAAELACAVGMSDRTIEAHLSDAAILRDRFGATLTALGEGRFSRAHAQVIADEGHRLEDDQVRARYEVLVLDLAAGLTTGRLRAAAKAIAETLHPVPLAERHRDARTKRHVSFRDLDDGMSELWTLQPSVLVHAIHDYLTGLAHTVKDARTDETTDTETDAADSGADNEVPDAGTDAADSGTDDDSQDTGIGETLDLGTDATGGRVDADANTAAGTDSAESVPPVLVDERTMDQLRADILADLILTGLPTTAAIDARGGEAIDAIRPIVQITVPAEILTGESDDTPGTPATLAGKCPVDPDSARRLAGTATMWARLFTDPCTGEVLAVDRRFPTEPQRRLLRARDEHCRFPGCRQPVWRCDIDHTIDHQHGGQTAPCNLSHVCRRHHVLKHQTKWTVEQHPGGVLVWTSPLGRVYTDRPPPTLRFVPSNRDPAPPEPPDSRAEPVPPW